MGEFKLIWVEMGVVEFKLIFFDIKNETSTKEVEKDLNVIYISTSNAEKYIWNGSQFCLYRTKDEWDNMIEDSKERVRNRPIHEINVIKQQPCEFSILWGLIKIKF